MPCSFRACLVVLLLVATTTWPGLPAAWASNAPDCAGCRFDFGKVAIGTVIEHSFTLRNDGDQPLRIAGVQLSPPLQLARMPAVIPPKGSAALKLSLDTSSLEGDYSGNLVVMLAGGIAMPRSFSLSGKIIPAIEVLPQPAFFLSTQKGVAKTATLEIINHASKPLDLKLRSQATGRYSLRLQPVEKGRRYRMTLTLPATAPVGRKSERLELETSNTAQPTLYVGLNTNVRERVYTFPDVVDFGSLTLRDLKSPQAAQIGAVQTLMVYQAGGGNFSVQARSTTPGVRLTVEAGPKRDRAEVAVSLLPSQIKPGAIRGTITLQTNDREFPTLTVPITGEIAPD